MFGVASLRTDTPSRTVGALLLVAAVSLVAFAGGITFAFVHSRTLALANSGAFAVALLTAGYRLRVHPAPTERGADAGLNRVNLSEERRKRHQISLRGAFVVLPGLSPHLKQGAWVFDGSEFIGYHDDNEIGKTSAEPPQSGKSDLYIGKDNVGNSIRAMNDEVRLYDRALSSSEITELATMDED